MNPSIRSELERIALRWPGHAGCDFRGTPDWALVALICDAAGEFDSEKQNQVLSCLENEATAQLALRALEQTAEQVVRELTSND